MYVCTYVCMHICLSVCLYLVVFVSVRNGEPWWRVRRAVHQTMMPPGAAHVYLPVQNQVADDFVRLLGRKLDEGSGKLEEDITRLLTKYTMEGRNIKW